MVLNYTMFGGWSFFLSLAFVLAMDLLLLTYLRMPLLSVPLAVGASAVPLITLCFSMATTVLASKGLLLVPILCAIIGMKWSTVQEVARAQKLRFASLR